jgi:(p)ppGpp synthase/HD superfamily hydrolase
MWQGISTILAIASSLKWKHNGSSTELPFLCYNHGMLKMRNAIPPDQGFEIEKATSCLVTNYNKSGHNQKPVILHSFRVAMMLLEMGYKKKIVIGAILHDILEDTDMTSEQLKEEFGQEILELVLAVSYNESIKDPIEQYKEMYKRIVVYGKDAVVLKAVDIAVNSLYISLVPDDKKQRTLVEKGAYFLELTKDYEREPALQLLKERNIEEIARLS